MSFIVKRAILENGEKQFGTGFGDRIVVGRNTFANNFMPLDAVDIRRHTKLRARMNIGPWNNNRPHAIGTNDLQVGQTSQGFQNTNREDLDFNKPMMLQSSVMGGARLNKNESPATYADYGQFGNPKGKPIVMVIDNSGNAGDFLKPGDKYYVSQEGLLHQILPNGEIVVKYQDNAYLTNDGYYGDYGTGRINAVAPNKTVPMQIGNTVWGYNDAMFEVLYYCVYGTYGTTLISNQQYKNKCILSSMLIGQDEKFIYYEQIFGGSHAPSISNYGKGTLSSNSSSYYPMCYKILMAIEKSTGNPFYITNRRQSTDNLENYYINTFTEGSRYYSVPCKRIAISGEQYYDSLGVSRTGTGTEVKYYDAGGGSWQPIMVNRIFIHCKTNTTQSLYKIDPNLLSSGLPNRTDGPKMTRLWTLGDSYYCHTTASEIVQSRENPNFQYLYTPYELTTGNYLKRILFEAKTTVSTATTTDASLGIYPVRYGTNTGYLANMYAQAYHDSRNCLIIEEGANRYLLFFTAGIRHIDYNNIYVVTSQATGEDAKDGVFMVQQIPDADEDALIFKSDIADWSYRKRFAGWVATENNKNMLFFNETGLHMVQQNAVAEEMAALDPVAMEFIQGIAMEPSGTNVIAWVEQLLPTDTSTLTTKRNTCQNGRSDIYQLQFGDYTDIDIRYIIEGDATEYREFTSKVMPTAKDSTTGLYIPKQMTVKVRVKTSIGGVASAFDDGINYTLEVSGGNKATDGLYQTGADVGNDYKITTTSTNDQQTFYLNYRDPLDKIIITAKLV